MQNACITQNNSREFLTLQQASDELGCTRRSLEKRIEDLEIDTFIQETFYKPVYGFRTCVEGLMYEPKAS